MEKRRFSISDDICLLISHLPEYSYSDPELACFSTEGVLIYESFSHDFGPMNLACVYRFCTMVDEHRALNPSKTIAVICETDAKKVTNAVFLLGAYLIMERDYNLEATVSSCETVLGHCVHFRDVSPGKPTFLLSLKDCWGGLVRAKELGWVDFGPEGFDLAEYEDLDSPLNADLHEIVPGKLLAMRGPRSLPSGAPWHDVNHPNGGFSHRDFSPEHYCDILPQFNVQAVVRLNDHQYPREAFHGAGIAVAELCFEDCTSPPVDVVVNFLAIAEALPGALAVHCKAGLGRTGTLIALYMMRHHGFSAREAMGWLRIVRPGSVIGPQQEFLCEREALMRRSGAPLLVPGSGPAPGSGAAAVQRFVDGVVLDYAHRYARALGAVAAAGANPELLTPAPGSTHGPPAPAHHGAVDDSAAGRFVRPVTSNRDWKDCLELSFSSSVASFRTGSSAPSARRSWLCMSPPPLPAEPRPGSRRRPAGRRRRPGPGRGRRRRRRGPGAACCAGRGGAGRGEAGRPPGRGGTEARKSPRALYKAAAAAAAAAAMAAMAAMAALVTVLAAAVTATAALGEATAAAQKEPEATAA
jgi:cell division cycle 14